MLCNVSVEPFSFLCILRVPRNILCVPRAVGRYDSRTTGLLCRTIVSLGHDEAMSRTLWACSVTVVHPGSFVCVYPLCTPHFIIGACRLDPTHTDM